MAIKIRAEGAMNSQKAAIIEEARQKDVEIYVGFETGLLHVRLLTLKDSSLIKDYKTQPFPLFRFVQAQESLKLL